MSRRARACSAAGHRPAVRDGVRDSLLHPLPSPPPARRMMTDDRVIVIGVIGPVIRHSLRFLPSSTDTVSLHPAPRDTRQGEPPSPPPSLVARAPQARSPRAGGAVLGPCRGGEDDTVLTCSQQSTCPWWRENSARRYIEVGGILEGRGVRGWSAGWPPAGDELRGHERQTRAPVWGVLDLQSGLEGRVRLSGEGARRPGDWPRCSLPRDGGAPFCPLCCSNAPWMHLSLCLSFSLPLLLPRCLSLPSLYPW